MKLRRIAPASFLSLAAILCVSLRLFAAPDALKQVDPKLFQELRWRSIGPFRGGRALAVTGVRGQPDVYYFGSVGGGVWKTNDAGRTWKPIFDSQPIASIGAIAVAPSDSNVIYVGSGEADMRSSISYGNGMYKSTDAGKTWSHVGLEDSRQIARILIDPRDANKVYVAALGHPYGPNQERGVFRSTDGGKHWKKVLFHDENTGAIDLAFEPGNPRTIYAALWQTRRPPWSIYPPSNGSGSGLYRSVDGGDHWQAVSQGLPSEGLGRMGIAFAPSSPKCVYLVVDAKDGGLFRSEDGGQTWQHISKDRRIWGRGWYFNEVAVDPKNPDILYIPNTSTYQSRDGGKTFTVLRGDPTGPDYHAMWIDPDDSQRMALSSDQGVIISHNGGETWSSWFNQPTAQFYHVATDNQFPYWAYGAQQDSGPAATPTAGKFRNLNFHDWRPLEAGDENGYIAPDPLNPGVIFGGFVSRQDLSNEQVQEMPPTLAQAGDFRRTWTLPLVYSPIDPHVLYFGSQILLRTADAGNSWQAISPDLTREDPGVPSNLDPATAADAAPKRKRRGVIYTIAPSSVKAGEIWAGTDDGQIHLTQDEGKSWDNVTPPELTAWSKVTHIEASHSDAGTAYAAIDRHRIEDYQPYLYRTRDFGKTWQRVNNGIPDGSFLNCVREDPYRKALLYACTEKGAYVSFNDGDDWQPLQLNLPVTSLRDLVVHEDDLVIATFGRSFWVLDNVTPLRQIDPHAAASDVWLFKPATALRVRPGSDQSTPIPDDETVASNPPNGAMIDYYLKEKSTAPIQLEIFDSEGRLVRRFASDDEVRKVNPDDLSFPVSWVQPPPPPSAEAGMHRFVWDLRYAGSQSRRRGSLGPWALRGNYTVKLSAHGKSSSQPLTIQMDPRVKTPQEQLVRQFELASLLSVRQSEVSAAVQRTNDLRKQIEARKKEAANNAEATRALDELSKKLDILTEQEGGGGFGLFGLSLPSKEKEPLGKVASALSGLISVIESADVAPSADATLASEKWDHCATESLARWSAFQKEDLAAINAVLQKVNLKALTVNESAVR